MTIRKPYIIIGASVGLVAAGYAVRKLLQNPTVYDKIFGSLDRGRRQHEDWLVDLNSEHSFPASDPPSFSPCNSR